jgi:hypothetical protein
MGFDKQAQTALRRLLAALAAAEAELATHKRN